MPSNQPKPTGHRLRNGRHALRGANETLNAPAEIPAPLGMFGKKTRPPVPTSRRIGTFLTSILLFFFFTQTAHAQAIKGQIQSVGIGGNGESGASPSGVYRVGSWVPVRVHLENRSPTPFVGHLGIEQPDLDGDKVLSVGPEFVLPPDVNGRTLWTYYWPRPDDLDLKGIADLVVLDKDAANIIAKISTPDSLPAGRGIGKSDETMNRSSRLVVVLGKRPAFWDSFEASYGGVESVQSVWVQDPSLLPDDVKGFDGVDLVVWEADTVKPSEISPEFQLHALLQWVQAGGHLVISVGSQGQEFIKAGEPLAGALPLSNLGERDLTLSDLATAQTDIGSNAIDNGKSLVFSRTPFAALADDKKPLVQVTGDLKAAARPVLGGVKGKPNEVFANHPLIVTGLFGRGAVTMITFDVSNPEINASLDLVQGRAKRSWMQFWSAAAGWPLQSRFFPANDPAFPDQHLATSPIEIQLGRGLSGDIDVKDVTEVRVLVAVLFLAAYWLVAGPIGHLVLRSYKVVHWSWWIFGGTVLIATTVAGLVVTVLHVSTYDVRHRSFVLGRVGDDAVTVNSFYGVYAPASGLVELTQKEQSKGDMNYLAPMCFPTTEDVKPYADPQSYQLWNDHTAAVAPVFRSTLKKMQARWTGRLPGVAGAAQYTADPDHILKGTLTNNTGLKLQDTEILLFLPSLEPLIQNSQHQLAWAGATPGSTYRFELNREWAPGETLDLEKEFKLAMRNGRSVSVTPPLSDPVHLEDMLEVVGWNMSENSDTSGAGRWGRPLGFGEPSVTDLNNSAAGSPLIQPDERAKRLMNFLADARNPDPLDRYDRRELVRGFERTTDATKMLHAAGALVIAGAGDINAEKYVKNPVALTVNGKNVEGKGDIQFAWALVVSGQPPANMNVSGPAGAARPGLLNSGPAAPAKSPSKNNSPLTAEGF